jgi:hypothetical protein
MIPKLRKVKYIDGYKLWIQFSDGKAGVIDLAEELWGPVFEPLQDLGIFQKVQVHPELETLSWPNGADFAPEFLYDRMTAPEETTLGFRA